MTGTDLDRFIITTCRRLNEKPFAYDPETDGGREGCADVVTTVLVAAGVLPRVLLAVNDTQAALMARGWMVRRQFPRDRVSVVVWQPVPESHGHSHIGISWWEEASSSRWFFNNSSRRRIPVTVSADSYPRPIAAVLWRPESEPGA